MSGAWKSSFSPESRGYSGQTLVGSTLWEGGARRNRPGYRPWSCEDRAGRPAVSLQAAWSSLMYGLLYTARWRSVGPAD